MTDRSEGINVTFYTNLKTNFIVDEEWLMPKRATRLSAGYDFVSPEDIVIPAHKAVSFGSRVKVRMWDKLVLQLYIRSSLGKRGLSLTNAVGIIDADYEDEIHAFIINNSDEDYLLRKGDRYMQGIFVDWFIIDDDCTETERTGGIGSTGK